jgi:ribosomal-protein-alanine N-acetyltransferase
MTPEALARLHAACFTAPRPWSAAEFTDLLADPGVTLETAPDGFLMWRRAGPEVELLTLAVDPSARRAGTGRGLVRRFLEAAGRAGAEDAFLEVAADNAPARALYASEGFAEIAVRPRYYARQHQPPLDAVVMRRACITG